MPLAVPSPNGTRAQRSGLPDPSGDGQPTYRTASVQAAGRGNTDPSPDAPSIEAFLRSWVVDNAEGWRARQRAGAIP